MDAHRLKVLYERQLAEDLRPPVAESVDRRGTRAMLRASEAMPGGKLCEEDRAGVWLWSDLHLLMPCRSPSSVDPSRLLRRWPTRSSSVGASRSSPRPWSSSDGRCGVNPRRAPRRPSMAP